MTGTPAAPESAVFFYGTFMHPDRLREVGVVVEGVVPARLPAHRITICPRVNVVADSAHDVHGSVVAVSDVDLQRLYGGLARDHGLVYAPRDVTVTTGAGDRRTARCYVCDHMPAADPDPEYVEDLIWCSRQLGHPGAYTTYLSTFLTPTEP